LKRCINWDRDLEAREDIDLTLWIMDVKGLPKKGNYHCELLLDSQLYARTTTKLWGDSLFWGEHFYFSDVPPITTVTVKLQREIDKKRKGRPGTSLVGTVEIKVEEITHKQGSLVEKWYQVVSSQKQDGAALRVKARYQVVSILPLKVYKEFFQFLETSYSTLCEVLEPVIPAKNKDEIAQTLIRILHSGGKSYNFLLDLVMAEVETLEDENLIFRGNTFATKAMDTYMKMVGDRYLKETLGQFVRYLYETEEECEVDPSKLPSDADLKTCQETLMLFVEKAWAKIVSSYTHFPTKLQAVFHGFRERLVFENKDNLAKKLISGSIFLRFFCPAILSPSLFHLVQAYPDEKASRRLTLVAKVLQSLANFTRY
jgi:RAS protein activator-like 2